jgi:hypothetical protein
MDYQEERLHRSAARRPDSPGGEEQLFERVIGDPAPHPALIPAPARPSLLQPQHDRHIVWRWHVRRRRTKP